MDIPSNIQAALNAGAVDVRAAIWVKAKNRETGQDESSGLHTGVDDVPLTVNGQERIYRGAGQFLSVSALKFSAGTSVQAQTIELSSISPEVIEMIRVHDTKYVPCEMHLIFLNHDGTTLGIVEAFDGFIDTVQIKETESDATVMIELVSALRKGTKPLLNRKSDAAMRARNPNDGFRKYAAVSGQVERFWGMESDNNHLHSRSKSVFVNRIINDLNGR